MSLEEIPENWLDTLEDEDVIQWRSNVDFPNSLKDMIYFIETHFPATFKRMVGEPSGMPQSFPHWWCYMRISRQKRQDFPYYPVLERWKKIIGQHHTKLLKGDVTALSVITVFITWLDQLMSDQILFQDEKVRWFVPRKYGNLILCNHYDQKPASRRETVDFIKGEGLRIFKERGFKEGASYWLELSKKYTF